MELYSLQLVVTAQQLARLAKVTVLREEREEGDCACATLVCVKFPSSNAVHSIATHALRRCHCILQMIID